MPLSPGDRLGPYEILSPLGAGGMGEVYKARDTRLDRTVAVKVLPKYIADRDDLRARFEREARAVASLKHPNICVLFDIGKQDGIDFMVLEHLEGETLAARAAKGPLPLDQVLKYATQIADALDRAHRSGVNHRDVKPANIMLTRDGVKVLDFGLAKTAPRVVGPNDVTRMPDALTSEGTILGTPQYMAPEQYEGIEADARSDIFAFGCVVYEMVTGNRCFDGKTRASLIAAVLGGEPVPMSALVPVTPAALERLVKRCIEKDPDDRYQSMRDVVLDLRSIGGGGTEVPRADRKSAPLGGVVGWGVAGVLGLALLFAWWRVPKAEDRPLVRLDADFGDISFTSAGGGSRVVISPDGGRLVYMMAGRLYTQRLDQLSSAELKGTEGAGAPFFSPDGRWVGFFAQGKLKKISVEGGAAITLCNSGFGGGSWGDGGTIIATTAGGLYKVPDTGGVPTPLTKLAQGEATHRWPQILPGSKAALFTSNAAMGDGFDAANVEVVLLKNGQRKTLVRGGTYGRYIPAAGGQGHLIYANQGTLFAAPFDLNQMEVRGTPVPVLQGVSTGTGGAAQLDFSRGGTLVYRKGSVQTASLTWLDSAGAAQPLALKPAIYSDLRLSPDGQRLALSIAAGANRDIWDYEWQRDTMTRLTFGGQNADTVWSPDGRYLVFASTGGIFWTRADGAGKRQPLMQSTRPAAPYSFTPDGKRLAFSQYKASELGSDLWTAPVEQDAAGLRLGKPEIFLQTPFRETTPAFSPDGHWLAYGSDESGNNEVYVRAFPDRGGRWQISNGGGSRPLWSRNGRELIFQAPAGKLMVASYAVKGDSFAADKPRGWFSNPSVTITQVAFGTALDVTPDGKRMVSMKIVGGIEEAPGHLTFLINFADELRRRSQ